MDVQTLLNIGNILMLIGTLLLIRAVLKNRNVLKGYDIFGSLLTLGGMLAFNTFYAVQSFWVSFVISMITTSYWAFVGFYTIKNKLKGRISWKNGKVAIRWEMQE